jgi:hypothetical protein
LGGFVVAAAEPATFQRTLAVTGEVDLEVSSNPGGMTITSGSATTVQVRAVIKPILGAVDLGLTEANILELQKHPPVEQAGNRIRIGYVSNPALTRGVTIHFDIVTPRTTRVRAHTTSGGIQIDGVTGPVSADSSSGRIEVSSAGAEVVVKTSSGAVVVRNSGSRVSARNGSGGVQVAGAQGPVDVETTSGRTEVEQVRGEVRSRTNSGSIRIGSVAGAVFADNHTGSIDALQLKGPVHAETRSGAIRIAQDSPAAISARTESGAIQVKLAAGQGYQLDALSGSGKISGPVVSGAGSITRLHELKGQVWDGGPLVDLDTRSSRITVN